jgi:hypothetical protein
MGVQSVSVAFFPSLPSQEELNLRDALAARSQSQVVLRLPSGLQRLFHLGVQIRCGDDAEKRADDAHWDRIDGSRAGDTKPEDRLEFYRSTLEDLGIGAPPARSIRLPYKG